MAYRIVSNKYNGEVNLLFTSNDSVVIAGNTSASNVALLDEVLVGASITQLFCGSPSGNSAYWEIKRGSNTVFVADSTAFIDFRGTGMAMTLDEAATLSANLVGSAAGTLYIQIKKHT